MGKERVWLNGKTKVALTVLLAVWMAISLLDFYLLHLEWRFAPRGGSEPWLEYWDPLCFDMDAMFEVTTWVPEKTFNGTIIFNDMLFGRVVELNMEGKVVWEYYVNNQSIERDGDGCSYRLTDAHDYVGGVERVRKGMPQFDKVVTTDIDYLENGHILITWMHHGVLEVDREGNTVNFLDYPKASHDADLLPNGHILIASSPESSVVEVDWDGNVYWRWNATEELDQKSILGVDPALLLHADYTHLNAATRLPNGDTLISLRNQNLILIVDYEKNIKWSYGGAVLHHQHDPLLLNSTHILIPDGGTRAGRVLIVNMLTQEIVWQPDLDLKRVRDANLLPNGNFLLVDTSHWRIIEVTPDGEIVWELKVPVEMKVYRAEKFGVPSD